MGLLSGVLEAVNKGCKIAIEDVEGAVKDTLTFLGNASSQCMSLHRVGILEEYKNPCPLASPVNCLLLQLIHCLGLHSQKKSIRAFEATSDPATSTGK